MELHDPLLPLWAMELMASAFLWVWLFCVGATVGSFLNVVVYRLPRGKNLAYPGSFCPRCGHPIRGQDNIPILSWLALWGRCRDCGGKISPRYFAVELTVATMFLVVLASEFFLPAGLGIRLGYVPRSLLLPHDGAAFWCMYAVHVGFFTTVLAAILIASDGFCVPASLFAPVILTGFALPLAWPEMRSIPAIDGSAFSGWLAGFVDGIAGLAAGAGVALLVRRIQIPTAERWTTLALIGLGCSVGVVLGWQATLLWFPTTWIFSVTAAAFLSTLKAAEEPAADHDVVDDAVNEDAHGSSAVLTPPMPTEETSPVPPTQELDPP